MNEEGKHVKPANKTEEERKMMERKRRLKGVFFR